MIVYCKAMWTAWWSKLRGLCQPGSTAREQSWGGGDWWSHRVPEVMPPWPTQIYSGASFANLLGSSESSEADESGLIVTFLTLISSDTLIPSVTFSLHDLVHESPSWSFLWPSHLTQSHTPGCSQRYHLLPSLVIIRSLLLQGQEAPLSSSVPGV